MRPPGWAGAAGPRAPRRRPTRPAATTKGLVSFRDRPHAVAGCRYRRHTIRLRTDSRASGRLRPASRAPAASLRSGLRPPLTQGSDSLLCSAFGTAPPSVPTEGRSSAPRRPPRQTTRTPRSRSSFPGEFSEVNRGILRERPPPCSYGSEGWGFESLRAHHPNERPQSSDWGRSSLVGGATQGGRCASRSPCLPHEDVLPPISPWSCTASPGGCGAGH